MWHLGQGLQHDPSLASESVRYVVAWSLPTNFHPHIVIQLQGDEAKEMRALCRIPDWSFLTFHSSRGVRFVVISITPSSSVLRSAVELFSWSNSLIKVSSWAFKLQCSTSMSLLPTQSLVFSHVVSGVARSTSASLLSFNGGLSLSARFVNGASAR